MTARLDPNSIEARFAPKVCPNSVARMRNLFLNVIIENLYAACHVGEIDDLEAHRSRQWLTTPTPDLREVLELSGIDPNAFLTKGIPRLKIFFAQHESLRQTRGSRGNSGGSKGTLSEISRLMSEIVLPPRKPL
jgi:hypothetical protein